MKQSADNCKFDENSGKFSRRVENTLGKGEIAYYEQFLLFPKCFQKAFFSGASKGVIVWEWVKAGQSSLDLGSNVKRQLQYLSYDLVQKEPMLVDTIVSFSYNILKDCCSSAVFEENIGVLSYD